MFCMLVQCTNQPVIVLDHVVMQFTLGKVPNQNSERVELFNCETFFNTGQCTNLMGHMIIVDQFEWDKGNKR